METICSFDMNKDVERVSRIFMWDQPYLETCCRSTLHRLWQTRGLGRPDEGQDLPCLLRLRAMGLANQLPNKRFIITPAGCERHKREIIK